MIFFDGVIVAILSVNGEIIVANFSAHWREVALLSKTCYNINAHYVYKRKAVTEWKKK